jgi:putative ABC transport system permease protein
MDSLLSDLRYAIRALLRSPGFTLVAVLTLALGIGANTAIFSVVNAAFVQPLPYGRGGRVVAAFETDKGAGTMRLSQLDLQDWQAQNRSFSHLAAYWMWIQNTLIGGEPMRLLVTHVTPEFFPVFDARPLLGAMPHAAAGGVLISEPLWRSAFGGSAELGGRSVVVEGQPYAVAGVMPARFDFPHGAEVWVPFELVPDSTSRSAHNYRVLGDLKDGVTLDGAEADLQAIAARIAAANPETNRDVGARVIGLKETLVGQVKPTVALLSVLAALVLLVACANVANLLVVRTSVRRREIAVRVALGAGGGRLARQALTESAVLALAGAGLGLVLAVWAGDLLRSSPAIAALPVAPTVTNGWVVAFTFVVALAVSLIFGLVPARQAVRTSLAEAIGQGGGRGFTRRKLHRGLIASQVALATVLLVGAVLTARSLLRLQGESLGFEPRGAIALTATPADNVRDQARLQAETDLLDRVRAIPGVTSAAETNAVPFGGGGPNGLVVVEGRATQEGEPWPEWRIVSDGFFRTLGVPLKRGREFTPADRGGMGVAVVNEAMARIFWPGKDPVGARVAVPGLNDVEWQAHQSGREIWFTVVGVAGDIRDMAVGEPPAPTIYLVSFQHPNASLSVIARSALPPASLRLPLLAAARAVSPGVPVRVAALGDFVVGSIATPRLRALLTAAFGLLALALAAVGIGGVSAHVTAQSTAEIGIRMALGAHPWQVLRAVAWPVTASALVGLAIGLAVAAAGSRAIAGLLYGIAPTDPVAFAAVAAVLAGVAVAAAYLPARRATRVDPMEALRSE